WFSVPSGGVAVGVTPPLGVLLSAILSSLSGVEGDLKPGASMDRASVTSAMPQNMPQPFYRILGPGSGESSKPCWTTARAGIRLEHLKAAAGRRASGSSTQPVRHE